MLFHAVYHRPKGNFAYAYDANTIHIRIRTAKDDVKRCYVLFGDKYDWRGQSTIKYMILLYSDELFDYWQVEVQPPNRRLCYMFKLESEKEEYWYTEYGFYSEQPVEINTMFEYPFLNEIDIFTTPDWVKDAVFYQIFPERFANGDKTNDPEIIEKWYANPTRDNFFGGDLQGIIDHLDYLEHLGIDALYLTPIFEANTNHKYDTKDYMKIDPHFGNKDTLKELVSQCHDKGIRVILDAVFNHSGYYFAPFQDVIKRGRQSEYWDWFHIYEYPIKTDPSPNYDTFAFEYHMPKLNTENPQVKEYLLNVAQFWIEEVDIDGWRLDVANEVDHEFWREFRKVVKWKKPEAYILGEVWHDAHPWLKGDQFDGVMNYPFTNATIDFFCKQAIDAREYANLLGKFMFRYPHQVNKVLLNILDSHDTPRLLNYCRGNKDLLKLAVLFQMTYIGTPCIYYGDEIGMTGGNDPDCRRTMIWHEKEQDRELLEFYRKCIMLRKDHRALRRGQCRFIYAQDSQLVMHRYIDSEDILIAFNVSNKKVNIEVDIDRTEKYSMEIFPYGYKVICLENSGSEVRCIERSHI